MTESSDFLPADDAGSRKDPEGGDVVDVVGEPVSRRQAVDLGYIELEGNSNRRVVVLLAIAILLVMGLALAVIMAPEPAEYSAAPKAIVDAPPVAPEPATNLAPPTTAVPELPAPPATAVPELPVPPTTVGPELPAPSMTVSGDDEKVVDEETRPSPSSTVWTVARHTNTANGVLYAAEAVIAGAPVLMTATGWYHDGTIAMNDVGTGDSIATVGLAGAPAGIGWLRNEQDHVIAVPDFRGFRLRFFKQSEDALFELPSSAVDMPGRPVCAAFAPDEGQAAVVCRTRDGLVVSLVRYGQSTPVTSMIATPAVLAGFGMTEDCLDEWTPDAIAAATLSVAEGEPIDALALLWRAACAPAQETMLPVYQAASRSAHSEVRRRAADYVLASGCAYTPETLSEFILNENDTDAVWHIAGNIGELPEERAVPTLLEIILSDRAGPLARAAVADQLRLFSGSCLSDDPECWRAWMEEEARLPR